MRVLFVASGNSKDFELSPFIISQGECLRCFGIDVQYFSVLGNGISGYIKSAKRLRLLFKEESYDLIHAHYSLCGWVAVLSRIKIPIVLSIMGDDAYGTYYKPHKVLFLSRYLTVLTYLIQPFVKAIISKSNNIDKYVYRRRIATIIPNGVDLEQFQNYNKEFRSELGLDPKKKYLLFLANIKDKRKNFEILKQAHAKLNDDNVEIIVPYPVPHDKITKYLWSADVFILTSFMEGSPNVLKEAMACNCPVVTTDVGDASWVIGNTEGCYITEFSAEDLSEKIKSALDFAKRNKRTKGRDRIMELGLDAESVAKKIIAVYNSAIKSGN
jgi:teichuronic acid biosynthesis glycosyltransferase TuaC